MSRGINVYNLATFCKINAIIQHFNFSNPYGEKATKGKEEQKSSRYFIPNYIFNLVSSDTQYFLFS